MVPGKYSGIPQILYLMGSTHYFLIYFDLDVAVINRWKNADVHQYKLSPAGKNITIGMEKKGKNLMYLAYFANGIDEFDDIFGFRDIFQYVNKALIIGNMP